MWKKWFILVLNASISFVFFTHQQLWVACCPRAAQWRRWPTRGGGTLGSAVSRRLAECHSTTHSPPSWRPDCRNGDEEGFFWKVKITQHVIFWTNGNRTVLSQVNLVPLLRGKIKVVQTFYYNSHHKLIETIRIKTMQLLIQRKFKLIVKS